MKMRAASACCSMDARRKPDQAGRHRRNLLLVMNSHDDVVLHLPSAMGDREWLVSSTPTNPTSPVCHASRLARL